MKRKILLTTLALIILAFPAFGQDKINKQIEDFNKKLVVAEWLVEYDFVAWRSTDLVMTLGEEVKKKLGPDWFCYKDSEGIWHAVYGTFDGENYDVAVQITEKTKEKPEVSQAKPDPKMLVRFASALRLANAEVTKKIDRRAAPRFNQYIRENDDKSFTVWILPAFQPNGAAVYGGEFIFKTDPLVKKVVESNILLQDNFRFFMYKPPRDISLNFSEYDFVPLHGAFFALYYKRYFTSIRIETKRYFIEQLKVEEDEIWTHIEKAVVKKKVKEQKPKVADG